VKHLSPQFIRWAALAIVATHTALLAWSAYRQSPTRNEVAHLVAGISDWQFGRFDVYRVNPPLSRLVAAIPVLLSHPKTNWERFVARPGARPELALGKDFIAANRERSLWLYTIARWACIPFSWLGAWICFLWARQLNGEAASLLALTLWCFCPNIIANAQLVTPDAAATAFGLAASYCFWRWLKTPTFSSAFFTGVALGLAQLTKFTWLLLFILWPMLWIVSRSTASHFRTNPRRLLFEAGQLGVAVLLSCYVINLGYGFDGAFQRLRDFRFVSDALAEPETADGDALRQSGTNRFTKSWFGAIPVPFPRHFVLGFDLQKRDLEHFPQQSYLRGRFQQSGWWYFYLYALAIKVPLGFWLLLVVALLATRFIPSPKERPNWRDRLVLLAPGVAVLTLVSTQTHFTIHSRYVLPALPYAFIWMSRLATVFCSGPTIVRTIAAAGLTWGIASSLWIYPHSLSYFNEMIGGPNNGHSHLLDSNIDWGQDLVFLRDWVDRHSDARPLHIAYVGSFDPADVGVSDDASMPAKPDIGSMIRKEGLEDAWYAISVDYLHGNAPLSPVGHNKWDLLSPAAASHFLMMRPTERVGYSIYIFHVRR